jgi:succinyl-CoA synthetase alpha subunit
MDKILALEKVGIRVTRNPSKIGEEMLNMMKERRLL